MHAQLKRRNDVTCAEVEGDKEARGWLWIGFIIETNRDINTNKRVLDLQEFEFLIEAKPSY